MTRRERADRADAEANVEVAVQGAVVEPDGVAAAGDAVSIAANGNARPAIADESFEGPSSAEYSIAFSPRNVAVGLAIVAGLVAFAVRRRRRSTRTEGD
jgi:hypothetical protein